MCRSKVVVWVGFYSFSGCLPLPLEKDGCRCWCSVYFAECFGSYIPRVFVYLGVKCFQKLECLFWTLLYSILTFAIIFVLHPFSRSSSTSFYPSSTSPLSRCSSSSQSALNYGLYPFLTPGKEIPVQIPLSFLWNLKLFWADLWLLFNSEKNQQNLIILRSRFCDEQRST